MHKGADGRPQSVVDAVVVLLASLRGSDADAVLRAELKRQGDAKRALSLLAAADAAYYDGHVLTPEPGKDAADTFSKYQQASSALSALEGTADNMIGPATGGLRAYASLRANMVLLYRQLAEDGIDAAGGERRLEGLIEGVWRVCGESSPSQARQKRPDTDHRPAGSPMELLRDLVYVELRFLCCIHSAVREAHRLHMPAAVVRLSGACRHLAELVRVSRSAPAASETVAGRQPSPQSTVQRLLRYLASLQSAVQGLVTLVFSQRLRLPVGKIEPQTDKALGSPESTHADVSTRQHGSHPAASGDSEPHTPTPPAMAAPIRPANAADESDHKPALPPSVQGRRRADSPGTAASSGDIPAAEASRAVKEPKQFLASGTSLISQSPCSPVQGWDSLAGMHTPPDQPMRSNLSQTYRESSFAPLWLAELEQRQQLPAKRASFFSRGRNAPGLGRRTGSLLDSFDALLKECHSRLHCSPRLHVFYNGTAPAITKQFQVDWQRRAPWATCASVQGIGYEEPGAGAEVAGRGLRGFPCVASLPADDERDVSENLAMLVSEVAWRELAGKDGPPKAEWLTYDPREATRRSELAEAERVRREQNWEGRKRMAQQVTPRRRDLLPGQVEPSAWVDGVSEMEKSSTRQPTASASPEGRGKAAETDAPPSPSSHGTAQPYPRCSPHTPVAADGGSLAAIVTRAGALFYLALVFDLRAGSSPPPTATDPRYDFARVWMMDMSKRMTAGAPEVLGRPGNTARGWLR
eukprot:TRINITY_DN19042_c0_g1_i1.p1 TRINITY_DN19042_c0_g1~~TRINITY_DN19042_c0_g1_i1.p1  ORF type:complete len:753 (+),score=201.68 TRINITY_DN19042_c0_g1_i1:67-2325(+)